MSPTLRPPLLEELSGETRQRRRQRWPFLLAVVVFGDELLQKTDGEA
jgi:hypothetical protein